MELTSDSYALAKYILVSKGLKPEDQDTILGMWAPSESRSVRPRSWYRYAVSRCPAVSSVEFGSFCSSVCAAEHTDPISARSCIRMVWKRVWHLCADYCEDQMNRTNDKSDSYPHGADVVMSQSFQTPSAPVQLHLPKPTHYLLPLCQSPAKPSPTARFTSHGSSQYNKCWAPILLLHIAKLIRELDCISRDCNNQKKKIKLCQIIRLLAWRVESSEDQLTFY